MGKAPCCIGNGIKKGPWTPEEDQKLVQYIQNHGHGSWRALPKLAGLNRCGKSCRLRWTNYLRPDIKRGKFSPEEEQTILNLHAILGNKWSAIAMHLPGRTDNEIKNFWNTHLKKKLIQMGFDPMTHRPCTDFFTVLPQLLALLQLRELVAGAQHHYFRQLGSGSSSSGGGGVSTAVDDQLTATSASFPSLLPALDENMIDELPSLFQPPAICSETNIYPAANCSALPPLAHDHAAMDDQLGDSCSISSCAGNETATTSSSSFWSEFMLDDQFITEFAESFH